MSDQPASADLSRMLTLVAHELRTPLTVAAGYLKMLDSERFGTLAPGQRSAVAAAIRSCEQLLALAADLSTLARLDRGELALAHGPVRASALIDAAIAACPASEHHTVQYESAGTADPTLLADGTRLGRALTALLTAVGRAVPDGTTVRVERALETAGDEGWLVIGIGKADAAAEAAPKPLDLWQSGLGVALPLALRIVSLEGGTVEADSMAVRVRLPVAAGRHAAGHDADSAAR